MYIDLKYTYSHEQDLRQWNAWGEVYRAYMASLDTEETKTSGNEEKTTDDTRNKRRRRSRKSRWGQEPEKVEVTTEADVKEPETKKRKRKSRWGKETSQSVALSSFMSPDQLKLMQCRAKVTKLDSDLAGLKDDPQKRQEIVKEKEKLLRDISELAMKTANAARGGQQFVRKLYAPVKEYPDYNFMGLLIGPRGNTHRRMEKETNCKIAIRGKGSVKTAMNTEDEEALHVIITGTNLEEVNKAETMIAELLVPVDDDKNPHKVRQLRELAIIRGTFREDNYCTICGEKGHKQHECPNRQQTLNTTFEIRCSICGGYGHLTKDCKGKDKPEQLKMDNEFFNFMAEVGESVETGGAPLKTDVAALPASVPASTGVPTSGTATPANDETKETATTTEKTPTPMWQPMGGYVAPPLPPQQQRYPPPMQYQQIPYGYPPPQMQYRPPYAYNQQYMYAPRPPQMYGQQYQYARPPPPQQQNNYSAVPPPPQQQQNNYSAVPPPPTLPGSG